MTTKSIFAIIAAVSLLALVIPSAYAQQIQQGYPVRGTETSDEGDAVSNVIFLDGANSISLTLVAIGGDFNETQAEVSVSIDGINFVQVDSIELLDNSTAGIFYNADNLATEIPVNVVSFPYVNVTTTDGVGSVSEELTWVARP